MQAIQVVDPSCPFTSLEESSFAESAGPLKLHEQSIPQTQFPSLKETSFAESAQPFEATGQKYNKLTRIIRNDLFYRSSRSLSVLPKEKSFAELAGPFGATVQENNQFHTISRTLTPLSPNNTNFAESAGSLGLLFNITISQLVLLQTIDFTRSRTPFTSLKETSCWKATAMQLVDEIHGMWSAWGGRIYQTEHPNTINGILHLGRANSGDGRC